jgi:hypothetical protein
MTHDCTVGKSRTIAPHELPDATLTSAAMRAAIVGKR